MGEIIQGNCLEVMASMESNSVDLIVTDPPYLIVSGGMTTLVGGIFDRNKHEHTATGKMFEHNDITFTEWLPDVYRLLKPGSHAYIMASGRVLNDLTNAALASKFEFQNLLVWDKTSVTPNRYYMQRTEFVLLLKKGASRTINDPGYHNILKVPNEVGEKLHPTQKPIPLMEILIKNSSNEGDTVLDPFAGSGATIVAAKKLRRKGVGIELDPSYAKVAQARVDSIKQMTLL